MSAKCISKTYKCQHCKQFKEAKAFYRSQSGRVSPYCIECNPDASLLSQYKTQIRRQGSKAFALKIEQKERQLNLMLRALSEVKV